MSTYRKINSLDPVKFDKIFGVKPVCDDVEPRLCLDQCKNNLRPATPYDNSNADPEQYGCCAT